MSEDEKPWKNLVLVRGDTPGKEEDSLVAHRAEDGYWKGRISQVHDHTYEPEIWHVINGFLDENSIFIDGGANIGVWSCAAAAKIGNPSQVIAVEPSSETLPQLRQNAELNGNSFTILDKALWKESGKSLPFNQYDDHSINSLCEMSKRRIPAVINVTTITVDGIVDSILSKTSKPDKVIIKLDVENSEFDALQGAVSTLKKMNSLVIYEDHRTIDPGSELTAKILGQGLHVYYVDPQNNVRAIHNHNDLEPIKVPPRKGYNFLACMPGSQFDMELTRLCGLPTKPPRPDPGMKV